MGSYIDLALTSDEKVIYRGHLSMWHFFGLLSLAMIFLITSVGSLYLNGFLILPLAGAGVFLLLVVFIKFRTTEVAVTNKRIYAKSGFISRNTVEMSIRNTQSINVHQSIWGRIFNYGSLIIYGSGVAQAPIRGIANPMKFRSAFIDAQDRAWNR